MALKPEASLMVSLGTAAVVYAVFQNFTPSVADVRSLDPGNTDVQKSERAATWTAAGIVAGISLLAKDATIFVIGGAMTVAMAWVTRHADNVDQMKASAREIMPTAVGPVGSTPSGAPTAPPMTQQAINYGSSVL